MKYTNSTKQASGHRRTQCLFLYIIYFIFVFYLFYSLSMNFVIHIRTCIDSSRSTSQHRRTSLTCIRRRFQQAASSATFTYLSSTTLARKSRVLCHSIVTGLKSWMTWFCWTTNRGCWEICWRSSRWLPRFCENMLCHKGLNWGLQQHETLKWCWRTARHHW